MPDRFNSLAAAAFKMSIDEEITRFKFDYTGNRLDKKKKNISVHKNQYKNTQCNSQHKEDETSIKLQNQTSHLEPNIAGHSGLDPSTLQKSQSVEERVKKQGQITSEISQTVHKAEDINPSVILQTKLMDQTCVCDSDYGIKDTTNVSIMASVESENISEDQTEQIESTIDYDSDGDLQVVRKGELTDDGREEMCITIKHSLATELEAVGEQVWQGALLLSDYMLHQRSTFQGHNVVDLGAGTGLTSIVCAMCADHVFCTDTGENVLKLAQSNVDNAVDCFSYHQPLCSIDVKDLNWFTDFSAIREPSGKFTLSSRDLEMIKHSDVFIAADVIYDDTITDAFFSTIKYLMSNPPNKTLFIALERRLVFTIDDLDVSSPGYNHFRRHLTNLTKIFLDSTSPVKFSVEQLDTDFPQFFHYKRTNYLLSAASFIFRRFGVGYKSRIDVFTLSQTRPCVDVPKRIDLGKYLDKEVNGTMEGHKCYRQDLNNGLCWSKINDSLK